jgi:hypothetical protein
LTSVFFEYTWYSAATPTVINIGTQEYAFTNAHAVVPITVTWSQRNRCVCYRPGRELRGIGIALHVRYNSVERQVSAPEPMTMMMVGSAIVGLGLLMRRRNKTKS